MKIPKASALIVVSVMTLVLVLLHTLQLPPNNLLCFPDFSLNDIAGSIFLVGE